MWPAVILLCLSAWLLLLTYWSLKQADSNLGTPVTVLFAGVTILSISFAMELLSPTESAMLFWNSAEYVGFGTLMLGLGLLLFNYAGWVDQWDRRSLAYLSIVPLVILILVVTNPWTSFYYTSIEVSDFQGMSFLDTERAWGYWLMVAYILSLCAGMLYLLGRSFFGATQSNTLHIAVLLLVVLGTMALTVLPNPVALIPSTFIIAFGLGLMTYPVYHVTFKQGVFTGSLSYREVLDLSTDVKFIIHGDRVLFSNAAAKSVLGEPISVPPQIRVFVRDQGGASRFEEVVVWREGVEHFYDFEAIPITSRLGKFQGWLVSMKDISDQVRVREALRAAYEKIKLLSSISRHDMINQLTVITGMAYMLEEMLTSERSQRMLRLMNESVDSINRQLMFMKDYEMIGVTPPEWIILEDAIVEAAEKLEIRNAEVSLDVPAHEVLADPLLDRVFQTLFHNSMVHGIELSRIAISAEVVDEQLIIRYQDDGGGIPDEYREGLFDKGVGKNSGLGLFLARSILEVTGLNIEEAGGTKGVDFVITVPADRFRVLHSA